MPILCQLFDSQGRALPGQGATKNDILTKGLLHAAAHVWIWRTRGETIEVLLQKRAPAMRTWPDHFDISAAGHVDLGEDPLTAAMREAQEELGLAIAAESLQLTGIYRDRMNPGDGLTENEFQWIYTLRLPAPKQDDTLEANFTLQSGEVGSLQWKTLDDFRQEVLGAANQQYVPHGDAYFAIVIGAIEQAAANPTT